jgi:hypothetical protein
MSKDREELGTQRARADNAEFHLDMMKQRAEAAEAEVKILLTEIKRLRAENETLRGAMAADDERLKAAAERVWGDHIWGCDTPEKLADLVLHLRAEIEALRGR